MKLFNSIGNKLRLLELKDLVRSFKGKVLPDGTVVPRKYFRAARKAYTFKNRMTQQKKHALSVAAKALFGNTALRSEEGEVIRNVFRPDSSYGGVYMEVEQYMKHHGGDISKLEEIEARTRQFCGKMGDMEEPAFAHSRHLIMVELRENVDYLKQAIAEMKTKK